MSDGIIAKILANFEVALVALDLSRNWVNQIHSCAEIIFILLLLTVPLINIGFVYCKFQTKQRGTIWFPSVVKLRYSFVEDMSLHRPDQRFQGWCGWY